MVLNGNQTNFERQVPSSRGGTSVTSWDEMWMNTYCGPNWNFAWLRKANVMLDRIEEKMGFLSESARNYWMGVGRFYRALEYSGLVAVFGDVPYYEHEIGSADYDELYTKRTPRNEVMDHIYDDFEFAMANVTTARNSKTELNLHVIAAFVSRWALFEGTWQKYHEKNTQRSQKFLNLAVKAAEIVMNTGSYNCNNTDFRSLFGSNDLSGSPEVIMFRRYDTGKNSSHSVASECNFLDSRYTSANLSLVKSFICNDGSDWQTSADAVNRNFEMSNLIKTRDSRLEATFFKEPTYKGVASCLYVAKFINRKGLDYVDVVGGSPPTEFTSTNNVTAYPVMRYAEVLLNWIEAKAELDLAGVSQADLDRSVNAIRNRPIAPEAEALGVRKTAPLRLNSLPESPDRDSDVDQLIWEIRRERRMEFAFEYSRLMDLKRWKKLEYMDGDKYPDILRGTWTNLSKTRNLSAEQLATQIDLIGVVDMNGVETVYDGGNANIEGFFFRTNVVNRAPFLDVPNMNPYLAPVGRNQRIDYRNRGYDLAQTQGWSQDLE
jgi:hypothetical protein